MLRGRSRLPVLAELSGPPDGARVWSLRQQDFAALEQVLPRLGDRRVIVVSGEGGTGLLASIALASAASAQGRRTILVECDLGQPGLAEQVGLAGAPGLHEYLRWEAEPGELLQPLVLAGPATGPAADPLVCVCAGRPADNAETLLGLQSFSHMVEKLRAAYELVVIAGPPAAAEPGSCALAAKQADAVLVAAAGRSRPSRETRAAVRRLPAPVLGTIAIASSLADQRS